MKSLRSPIAIAAAALIATPPVAAQPIQLTPPEERADVTAEAAPPPVAVATPAPGAPLTPAPAPEEPAELRGPVGPLPMDLTLATPPPAPPPAPPSAAPEPTPVVAAAAPTPPPAPPPPPRLVVPTATVSVGVQDDYT
ncbi:MAG: hypothetical protein DCF16_07980, partial [Alphaproteobacteria bacterium]